MSVKYIKGDLLEFPEEINVIAHSCNGNGKNGVMGSGLALAIKNKFPKAFEVYEDERLNRGLQLGTFTTAVLEDGKRIANLITQERYGNEEGVKYVDYEAFYVALKTLRDVLEDKHKEGKIYTLGLPYNISCDRAKGDWRIISAMIEVLFADSPIKCIIVQLDK